jgi:hypothetical protein
LAYSIAYFACAEPDILVIPYAHEIDSMLPAEFGLSLITCGKSTKSLLATEERERLEVLLTHVFNRNSEFRDVNVQVLWRQPGWTCVLLHDRTFQATA